MKDLLYLKEVVTLELTEELCNGCGMCTKVCPHEVFEIAKGKAHIINRDYCMECGACALNCPMKAISVRSGVGCAAGIINGILKGTDATCDCGASSDCC